MIGLLFFLLMEPVFPAPIKDAPSLLAEAQVKAEQQGKLILVDWYNDWCPSCKRLDAFLERNPDFFQWVQAEFVFLKLHCEQGDSATLAQQLGVRGWPHFMIFDQDLALVERWVGFADVEGFRHRLKAAIVNPLPIERKWQAFQKSHAIKHIDALGSYFHTTGQYELAKKVYGYLTQTPERRIYAVNQRMDAHLQAFYRHFDTQEMLSEAQLKSYTDDLDYLIAAEASPTLIAEQLVNFVSLKDFYSEELLLKYLRIGKEIAEKPYQKVTDPYFNTLLNDPTFQDHFKFSLLSDVALYLDEDQAEAYAYAKKSFTASTPDPIAAGSLVLWWSLDKNLFLEESIDYGMALLQSAEKGSAVLSLVRQIKDLSLIIDKPEKAIPAFEIIAKLSPDTSHADYWSSEVFQALEQHDKVIKHTTAAIELAKQAVTRNKARLMKAEALLALNQTAKAREVLSQAEPEGKGYDACVALLKELDSTH